LPSFLFGNVVFPFFVQPFARVQQQLHGDAFIKKKKWRYAARVVVELGI
jgi:hypothetical protein